MASVIDLLRRANREEMVSKPVKMEVKRLSEVFGEPSIFELKPVSCAAWQNILDSDVEYRSGMVAASWAGAKDIPAEVLEKFGAADAPELLRNILKPGELVKLSQKAEEISGFGRSVEELKKIRGDLNPAHPVEQDMGMRLLYELYLRSPAAALLYLTAPEWTLPVMQALIWQGMEDRTNV